MWSILTLVLGVAVCATGGLVGLLPNNEKPLQFVPLYLLAALLFLAGLAMVFWFQPIGEYLSEAAAR